MCQLEGYSTFANICIPLAYSVALVQIPFPFIIIEAKMLPYTLASKPGGAGQIVSICGCLCSAILTKT